MPRRVVGGCFYALRSCGFRADSFFDVVKTAYAAAAVPFPQLVGVAFDEQIVEEVQVDEHDWLLDAVVTPTRTFTRGREDDAGWRRK